jgi:hypothetical protein
MHKQNNFGVMQAIGIILLAEKLQKKITTLK